MRFIAVASASGYARDTQRRLHPDSFMMVEHWSSAFGVRSSWFLATASTGKGHSKIVHSIKPSLWCLVGEFYLATTN